MDQLEKSKALLEAFSRGVGLVDTEVALGNVKNNNMETKISFELTVLGFTVIIKSSLDTFMDRLSTINGGIDVTPDAGLFKKWLASIQDTVDAALVKVYSSYVKTMNTLYLNGLEEFSIGYKNDKLNLIGTDFSVNFSLESFHSPPAQQPFLPR
jgi:hypothetical protein